MSRCCVANLTHMLQTSSFNQTHVLVASNNISLSCLEGRIYIITLLNPLPVLIILLNHYQFLLRWRYSGILLSFTRSFMINTHPLIGCLENSDWKVKQFRVIPQIASSRLVYSLFILSECVWFCNVTPDLYWEIVTQQTLCSKPNGLPRMAFTSSSVINLVYSYKTNQTRFECSLLF